MNTIDNLNELTVEITEFLDKLADVQQKKLDAVHNNDLALLDKCMKQEQAAIMKSKSLDRKREAILLDLGYSGLSYKQILEKVSEEKKKVSAPLFEKLRIATNNFNELNNVIKTAIEVNLHSINNTLDNLKNSNTKSKNRGKISFTDRMV
ncbi:MAG: flagellar export chaperone FlgN [Anaerotignaceae bacterium]